MIKTQIVNESPIVVLHRLSGRLNEAEVLGGVREAVSIIDNITGSHLMFRLLLDMRGYISEDVAFHKLWSLGFKEQLSMKENVERVAIVGDDSPNLRAEKELMESAKLRFFTEAGLATQWLRGVQPDSPDVSRAGDPGRQAARNT